MRADRCILWIKPGLIKLFQRPSNRKQHVAERCCLPADVCVSEWAHTAVNADYCHCEAPRALLLHGSQQMQLFLTRRELLFREATSQNQQG